MTTAHRQQHAPLRPTLILSDHDRARLDVCLARAFHSQRSASEVEALEAELTRARIVPADALPEDVVALGTTVVVENVDDDGLCRARREITVVLPEEADVARGRISVLAPIGAAVIGMRVGAEIDWPLPGGRTTRLRVASLARGDVDAR